MTRDGDPPIELQELVVELGGERVVDHVDLAVPRGCIHALVGLNGAGKTTLLRALVGQVVPSHGTVRVLGAAPRTAGAATWSRVGHLVGAPLVYPELTVRRNLAVMGQLRGRSAAAAWSLADEAVEQLGLTAWADRPARHLSAGNRQRLGLAEALAHRPEVVILDEPATALDPGGLVLVRELLRGLRAAGSAIVVSGHHLDELARLADRIDVVHGGRLVGTLDPDAEDVERRFFSVVHAAAAGGVP